MKYLQFTIGVICIFAFQVCFAQQQDPVLMTINGQDVLRSEFEYSFKKNNSDGVIDKKSVDEYVDLFINYKLKVLAAEDAQLDTLSSYKKEFKQYRDQQLMSSFVTAEELDAEAKKVYETTKKSIGDDGLIRVAHILFYLPHECSKELQEEMRIRADSVYKVLQEGADFATMAKQFSGDNGSAMNGGELPWLSKGQTLEEFEKAAFALDINEMSTPILSPVGYHIIKMLGKKQLEPFEELKSNIMKFLESRNASDVLANRNIKKLAEEKGVSTDMVLDERAIELSAKDNDIKYLIKEYHDGLLLYEISNRNVWEPATKDEEGLAKHFALNKDKYAWDTPRFKGIVYHVKTVADQKKVKKCIKKLPFDKWAEVLKNTFNNDSVLRLRAEKGIFKRGDNDWVDKLVFGVAEAKTKDVIDYPITDFFGKLITIPEDYSDVKAQVISDYQEKKVEEWVEELRKKYTFTVNQDVLKTVNNH